MKITNEERREVAENLRNMVDYSCRYSEQFYELLTETVMNDWDFHSFPDTAERLADLIDRPTCRNVYDESKVGACENGFECSECGNVVEDGEGWLVKGTFNYCSECGAEVVVE